MPDSVIAPPGRSAGAPPASKLLRVGALSRLATVDPRESDDTVSQMILVEIFETPYSPPFGSEPPEPVLFTGPLRSDGGVPGKPVYSAEVRPGITFSDGTPLTAEAICTSLRKAADFSVKASCEAQGNRVIFRLASPNPRFDLVLTQVFCGIVLEKGTSLLGTGPCTFPEGMTRRQILDADPLVLPKNPKYRGASAIDGLSFASYPASTGGGTEVLLEATKRAEIDFTYSLTSVDAAELQGHPFIPSIATGNATGILFLNTTFLPLRESAARRAIAHAINRREIARVTYARNPTAFVAASLVPPIMGRDQDSLAFDQKTAKEEIDRLGAAMPRKLNLLVTWSPRPYLPNPKGAAEIIKSELAELGITVNLEIPKDRTDFFDRVKSGRFEMALAGWIADSMDPADFFEALLHSAMIPYPQKVTATSNNLSRYKSDEMDAALTKFRAEPDETHRKEILRIVGQDAPLVPLIHGQAVAVYSRKLVGFRPNPVGRTMLANLRFMA